MEDVSVEKRLKAMVPAITFCMLPGYKKLLNVQDGFDFQNYCPRNTTDFKQCMNDMRSGDASHCYVLWNLCLIYMYIYTV